MHDDDRRAAAPAAGPRAAAPAAAGADAAGRASAAPAALAFRRGAAAPDGRRAGRAPGRRRLAAAVCAAVCGLPLLTGAVPASAAPGAGAAAAAFDLPALAALLAQRKAGEARFTEERFVGGLDQPLRASGTLSFQAPGRFARRTLEPVAESMVVDGNALTLQRGGRSRQLALDASPEVGALVEGVRGTLTGNADALARHFHARVEGRPAQWTLTLVPRDARLAAQVRELQIVGQGPDVRTVGLWLAGGDRSLMTIEPLAAAPR